MSISDWSSDVCSSDLARFPRHRLVGGRDADRGARGRDRPLGGGTNRLTPAGPAPSRPSRPPPVIPPKAGTQLFLLPAFVPLRALFSFSAKEPTFFPPPPRTPLPAPPPRRKRAAVADGEDA